MAKTDKLINEPATVTLPPLLSTNFQLSSRQCLIFTQHHITVWAGDDHNYALWAWRTHSSQDFSWILTHSFSPAPSQISTIFLVDSSQIFCSVSSITCARDWTGESDSVSWCPMLSAPPLKPAHTPHTLTDDQISKNMILYQKYFQLLHHLSIDNVANNRGPRLSSTFTLY